MSLFADAFDCRKKKRKHRSDEKEEREHGETTDQGMIQI